MLGKSYKVKGRANDPEQDDFIVMEELNHVVCLMNARTNNLHWVTRHILGIEYTQKTSQGTNNSSKARKSK